jgi:hypothetical protein
VSSDVTIFTEQQNVQRATEVAVLFACNAAAGQAIQITENYLKFISLSDSIYGVSACKFISLIIV